jgi:hypothetical protein
MSIAANSCVSVYKCVKSKDRLTRSKKCRVNRLSETRFRSYFHTSHCEYLTAPFPLIVTMTCEAK